MDSAPEWHSAAGLDGIPSFTQDGQVVEHGGELVVRRPERSALDAQRLSQRVRRGAELAAAELDRTEAVGQTAAS